MGDEEKVNILLVDDQPGKLLSYEAILSELGENLIKAASATEALQLLLKSDFGVVLIDVCMPELDGFELAAMIRQHPRFQRTAIIFVSAIQVTDLDLLARLCRRSRRLRPGTGRPRSVARQGPGVCRAVPEKPAA